MGGVGGRRGMGRGNGGGRGVGGWVADLSRSRRGWWRQGRRRRRGWARAECAGGGGARTPSLLFRGVAPAAMLFLACLATGGAASSFLLTFMFVLLAPDRQRLAHVPFLCCFCTSALPSGQSDLNPVRGKERGKPHCGPAVAQGETPRGDTKGRHLCHSRPAVRFPPDGPETARRPRARNAEGYTAAGIMPKSA